MKPAGICDWPPPGSAIAAPTFLRFGSPSWRPAPLGPIRENRNGGTEAAAAVTEAAVAATDRGAVRRPAVPPSDRLAQQSLADYEVALGPVCDHGAHAPTWRMRRARMRCNCSGLGGAVLRES